MTVTVPGEDALEVIIRFDDISGRFETEFGGLSFKNECFNDMKADIEATANEMMQLEVKPYYTINVSNYQYNKGPETIVVAMGFHATDPVKDAFSSSHRMIMKSEIQEDGTLLPPSGLFVPSAPRSLFIPATPEIWAKITAAREQLTPFTEKYAQAKADVVEAIERLTKDLKHILPKDDV